MKHPIKTHAISQLGAALLALCLTAAPALAEPKAMEPGSEELFALQDQTLNSNYQRILRAYADDPVFIEKLKAAQRAWLQFRDAELAALFPHADKLGHYGSVYEQAWRFWAGELTDARSRQLVRWLEGVEEGDVFAGSIKKKPVEPPRTLVGVKQGVAAGAGTPPTLTAVLRFQDERGGFLGEKVVGALGVIGNEGRRFRIRFLTVERVPEKPGEYAVTGKTRVGDNICDFTGTITVEAEEFLPRIPDNEETYQGYEEGVIQGVVTARLDLAENPDQPGTGRITGLMRCDVIRNADGSVAPDETMLGADGYANNQFVGQWTGYKTGAVKPVNFGALRIPHEGLPDDLEVDSGVGEFIPSEKLAADPSLGWTDYRVCMFGTRFPEEYPDVEAACERETREWWR